HLLRHGMRKGRAGSELGRHLERYWQHRIGNAVEEAPGEALLGAHRAAGVEQLGGASLADHARQHRAGAHVAAGKPDANEEERHPGARRCVAQVGKKRDQRACPGAHALDGRGHRLRAMPVISSVEGVCAGAGALIALFSDLRYAAPGARVAFLFVRVGLAGCDMGACAMLPRVIGQGRAAELLYTGRSMSAEEGLAWGFFNRVADPVLPAALEVAAELASGPTFAHAMTKKMLHQEWNASLDSAIEMEAQAQAICMQTRDFRRAYEAFAAKRKP